jgi:selenide,water dikinase
MGACASKDSVNLSKNLDLKNKAVKRIVCIGGGHCNCQVLKLLKKLIKDRDDMKITIVTDNARSYYSGMLPGSVSTLYKDEQIMVHIEPIAVWSLAEYIQQPVVKIEGNKNRIHLKNGQIVEYDVLCVNVGSRTKAGYEVPGVWDHSLTTRPINDLLPKIEAKENSLKEAGIVPSVVVCGGGAAGTELSMAFKARWTKLFGEEIQVTLLCSKDGALPAEPPATRKLIKQVLEERNIKIETGCRVKKIEEGKVILEDGREFEATVPIWATGADP